MIIKQNIYLTGFMGTGKSTIGRELAKSLGKKFIDMDEYIQKQQGKSVKEIFEEHGESFFREKEMEAAKELASEQGRIIATGGGTILNNDIRKLFTDTGLIICLFTDQDQLVQRLQRSSKRPMIKGSEEEVRERVDKLMQERQDVYSSFSIRVNTTNLTPQEVSKKIIKTLHTYRKILDHLHDQYIVIS